MRPVICILLVGVSAHFAVGQNFRDKKSQEFQFEEYKFPPLIFNPNLLQDSTWGIPEGRLHGLKRQDLETGKNYFQRDAYTKNNQNSNLGKDIYYPFDNMPCLKPYGLFRMNVLEPDMSLYNMPTK